MLTPMHPSLLLSLSLPLSARAHASGAPRAPLFGQQTCRPCAPRSGRCRSGSRPSVGTRPPSPASWCPSQPPISPFSSPHDRRTRKKGGAPPDALPPPPSALSHLRPSTPISSLLCRRRLHHSQAAENTHLTGFGETAPPPPPPHGETPLS
jgi:hypothetical protein